MTLAAEYTYVAGRARVKHSSRDDPTQEHYGVKRSDFILSVYMLSCTRIASDISLAKKAMLIVLSKKASRMKGIIELLKRDLMGHKKSIREGRFEVIIARGRDAIKGAKY